MKWNNSGVISALFAVLALSTSHATASVNQVGSNLRITLDNGDSSVLLTTLPNEMSEFYQDVYGLIDCVSGYYTEVYIVQETEETTAAAFCDVVNVRVAGLSGSNALAVGGYQYDGLTFGFQIDGTLDIRGGGENDTVIFGGDVEVGKLLMQLRGGNNRIRGAANDVSFLGLPPITSGSITVNTTLDIDTNSGDDRANFRALTVGGQGDISVGGGDDIVNIFGGGGPNSFGSVFIRLGQGDNKGSLRNSTCHHCQMFAGSGDDHLILAKITAGMVVDAIAGGGNDLVEVKNVSSASADVNANGGTGDADCLLDNNVPTTMPNGGSTTMVANFEEGACDDPGA